jgi:hypothetical protein
MSLTKDPLFYVRAYNSLNLPAVTLKDWGHIDFMLNNPRKSVAQVNELSQNAYYIQELLISNVISPKTKF